MKRREQNKNKQSVIEQSDENCNQIPEINQNRGQSTTTRDNKKTIKLRGKWYCVCVLGMIMAVFFSLYGPQLFFETQDHYRMSATEFKKREQTDATNLNLGYEKDIYTRMNRFAQESRHYVTAIDYDSTVDEDTLNSLRQIMEQDFLWILWANEVIADPYYMVYDSLAEVTELKKYIIYGDDFNEGVALMAWYFDYMLENGMRIQCLADVETHTIYYLRVSGKNRNTINATENVWTVKYKLLTTMLSNPQGIGQSLPHYCNGYYDTETYQKLVEKGEGYLADLKMGILPEDNKKIYDSVTEDVKAILDEYATEADEEMKTITVPLQYEDGELHFTFHMTPQERFYNPNLTIGIREIGELIPEFTTN